MTHTHFSQVAKFLRGVSLSSCPPGPQPRVSVAPLECLHTDTLTHFLLIVRQPDLAT